METNHETHDDIGKAITGMSFADYCALPGINATSIKAGRLSMLHMHHARTGPPRPTTPAQRWGTLVHAALLEPDLFDEKAVVFTGDKRGAAWKAFAATHDSAWIMTDAEREKIMEMRDNALGDRQARSVMKQCDREVALIWQNERYGRGKARVDGLNERSIIMIKTAAQIEQRRFILNGYNLGYELQAAWYWHGAKMVDGTDRIVWMIVLESAPPYDIVTYRFPQPVLDQALEVATEIAINYRACEVTESFPGVAKGDVLEYELPAWLQKAAEWEPTETTNGGDNEE